MDNRNLFYGPGYNSPFDNLVAYINKQVGLVQGMISTIGSGSAAPTTTNISSGKSSIWYNTTTSSLGVYANYNGAIVSVAGGGGGGVSTFNGRSGTVVPTTGDYTFSQIGSTPTTLSGYGITNGQTTITLTTTGSGAATLSGATLNIPTPGAAYITSLTTTGTSGAAAVTSGALNIPQYQGAITLTTTGTSGAATLVGVTLNIPQYTSGTAANPTGSVGLTVVNGSATTFLRSDGAPALSQAIAPTWTSLHTHSLPSLATTVTPAITLINTSSAASGAQQISPSIHFQGQGWASTGGTSEPVDGYIYMLPVQGTAIVGSTMVFAIGQDSGSLTNVLTLNDGGGASINGPLAVTSAITSSANIGAGATGAYFWGTGSTTAAMYSDATYTVNLRNGTNGCQLQVDNTYTSGTVFEGGIFGFKTTANVLSIGTVTTGGTLRNTQFVGGTVNLIATAIKRTTVADAAYSILTTDFLVAYTTLTAARAVTLPTAIGVTGQEYIIKDETGNASTDNITIGTTSSQLIDGSSTKVINTAYGVIRVYSNGANWFTF